MYAQVTLGTAEARNANAVPPDAVDGTGDNQRLFLVDSDGMVQVRKVAHRDTVAAVCPDSLRSECLAMSSSPAATPISMTGKRFSPVCSPPEGKELHVRLCHPHSLPDHRCLPHGLCAGREQRCAHAGRYVSFDERAGRHRGDLLFRYAAGADRRQHHLSPGALLYPGQRHRSHGVAVARRRQHHSRLLPAGYERRYRCGDHRQSGRLRHEGPASRHLAAGGAQIRRLQPARLPGHDEWRRA